MLWFQSTKDRMLKRADILVLIVPPFIAAAFSLIFRVQYLSAILLFFLPLACWFSYRTPRACAKSGLFSIIVSLPLLIVVEYIALLDHAWWVPQSFAPFRILGIVPLEDCILALLFTYLVILVYEHFLDKGKQELIDRRMKYFIWPLVVILIPFFTLAYTNPGLFTFRYAYLWTGIVFGAVPVLAFLLLFPRLISRYAKVGMYFFLLLLLFELVGLSLGHWEFPQSHFIGWVVLGSIRFPIEELIIWMGLSSVAILTFFEFFDDDRK